MNALIGISNNIASNRNKIRVWAESFRRNTDGEVILLASDPTEEEIDICNGMNITCHVVHAGSSYYINNKRLFHTVEYLKQSNIDNFMVTDVFDVIFQGDPFAKFNLEQYDFFASGEGVLIREEPWNKDVLNKCFPESVDICNDIEVVCSGVMGGKREALIPILSEMDTLCENAKDGHNIRDQAALIILIAKKAIPKAKIFNLNEGWAMHCQCSGPTEFLTSWGLGGNVTRRYGGLPVMKEGIVYTHTGEVYDIVHQFNRIPEWHKQLVSSYE